MRENAEQNYQWVKRGKQHTKPTNAWKNGYEIITLKIICFLKNWMDFPELYEFMYTRTLFNVRLRYAWILDINIYIHMYEY